MAKESHLLPIEVAHVERGPTRIYVCRIAIERNRKEGCDFAPITVRHPDGSGEFTRRVKVHGPCEVVYELNGLEDGTSVWVETDSPVEFVPEP